MNHYMDRLQQHQDARTDAMVALVDMNDVAGLGAKMCPGNIANLVRETHKEMNVLPIIIVLVQVGSFVEALGIDAVFLVALHGVRAVGGEGELKLKAGVPMHCLGRALSCLVVDHGLSVALLLEKHGGMKITRHVHCVVSPAYMSRMLSFGCDDLPDSCPVAIGDDDVLNVETGVVTRGAQLQNKACIMRFDSVADAMHYHRRSDVAITYVQAFAPASKRLPLCRRVLDSIGVMRSRDLCQNNMPSLLKTIATTMPAPVTSTLYELIVANITAERRAAVIKTRQHIENGDISVSVYDTIRRPSAAQTFAMLHGHLPYLYVLASKAIIWLTTDNTLHITCGFEKNPMQLANDIHHTLSQRLLRRKDDDIISNHERKMLVLSPHDADEAELIAAATSLRTFMCTHELPQTFEYVIESCGTVLVTTNAFAAASGAKRKRKPKDDNNHDVPCGHYAVGPLDQRRYTNAGLKAVSDAYKIVYNRVLVSNAMAVAELVASWKSADAQGFLCILSMPMYIRALHAHSTHVMRRGWCEATLDENDFYAVGLHSPHIAPDVVVKHTCNFKTNTTTLITASNATGKTTFQRTLLIACVLNNAGLRVPATKFVSPNFASLFFRLPVGDNTIKGLSSFELEVSEMGANINDAKEYSPSLLFVDELGRGTCENESVAFNVAVINYLKKNSITTMLATHVHALLDVFPHLPRLTLTTDFMLREGCCRSSDALRIVARNLFPAAIIDEMRELLSKESDDVMMPKKHQSLFQHALFLAADMTGVDGVGLDGPDTLLPPSASASSSLYVIEQSDGNVYVGETKNASRRLAEHRQRGRSVQNMRVFMCGNKSDSLKHETMLQRRLLRDQAQYDGQQLVDYSDANHELLC